MKLDARDRAQLVMTVYETGVSTSGSAWTVRLDAWPSVHLPSLFRDYPLQRNGFEKPLRSVPSYSMPKADTADCATGARPRVGPAA